MSAYKFATNYQFDFTHRKMTKTGAYVHQYISIEHASIHDSLLYFLSMSQVLFDVSLEMFVTPSEFYSNFEKLLLPFDTTTWIMFVATFCLAAFVVFIMKFMPEKV